MNGNTVRDTNREELPEENELIDVKEYAKAGKAVPPGKLYRIRIDKTHYEVAVSSMTGRELLMLAGKTPVERYRIDEKLRGGQTRRIGLDESADFTTPGLDQFMTLPLDQTEG